MIERSQRQISFFLQSRFHDYSVKSEASVLGNVCHRALILPAAPGNNAALHEQIIVERVITGTRQTQLCLRFFTRRCRVHQSKSSLIISGALWRCFLRHKSFWSNDGLLRACPGLVGMTLRPGSRSRASRGTNRGSHYGINAPTELNGRRISLSGRKRNYRGTTACSRICYTFHFTRRLQKTVMCNFTFINVTVSMSRSAYATCIWRDGL